NTTVYGLSCSYYTIVASLLWSKVGAMRRFAFISFGYCTIVASLLWFKVSAARCSAFISCGYYTIYRTARQSHRKQFFMTDAAGKFSKINKKKRPVFRGKTGRCAVRIFYFGRSWAKLRGCP